MKANRTYKVLKRIGVLLLFVGLLILSYMYNSVGEIDKVEVQILNPEYGFLNDTTVMDFMQKEGLVMEGQVQKENIPKLEKALRKNNYIDSSEVYVSRSNVLVIQIRQLEPIARVFLGGNQKSFYMKSNDKLLPVSPDYTARVPIVTGFQHVVKDSAYRAGFALMMDYIHQDSFWNAQIQQLDIRPDRQIVIYPQVGNHEILFGYPDQADAKLDNLFEFYKQVLNKQGFDKYEVVDIRYDHQIVASPSIHKQENTTTNL